MAELEIANPNSSVIDHVKLPASKDSQVASLSRLESQTNKVALRSLENQKKTLSPQKAPPPPPPPPKKQTSLAYQLVNLAIATNKTLHKKIESNLDSLDQDAHNQKTILSLKEHLIKFDTNNHTISSEAKKLIEELKQQGIIFKDQPRLEELDIEIEKVRLAIKNKYQKIENFSRDKNSIFDIAKKIMELENRLIDKINDRMNHQR